MTAAKTPSFWTTPLIDIVLKLAVRLEVALGNAGIKPRHDMAGLGDLVGALHKWAAKSDSIKNLSIVEAFLWFGAVGLAANVANA